MKPTGLSSLPFTAMLREVYGPSDPEDFHVIEGGDGWTFVYMPLQVVTGRILRVEAEQALRRLWERRDVERWMREAVRKACDISPLRIMQIAQVGV